MSTSPTDTVAQLGAEYGMPFDVPVHGPTERLIADGFGLMLGEGVMLLQTLRAAAVPGTSPSNQWWSGTDENGALANTACADWTDAGDTAMGNVGSATEADSAWLNDFAGACATAMPVLCACW